MPRPDDATVQLLVAEALGLPGGALTREVLQEGTGRCVERVSWAGRVAVLKWRDDRVDDREALLYAGLAPAVLAALGAPRMLGAARAGATHLLLLEWLHGRAADYGLPADVTRAAAHLGRLHAATARRLQGPREGFAGAAAWRVLLPDAVDLGAGAADPAVLDPGDLRGSNVLLQPDGTARLLDFEGLAVRPRRRAVRAWLRDAPLPPGPLADGALLAYWRAAGWPGSLAAFCEDVLAPGG